LRINTNPRTIGVQFMADENGQSIDVETQKERFNKTG
jgi:hypothetical protein